MSSGGFHSDHAVYLGSSCLGVLVLSLVISIWHADLSAVVALLGLVIIYTARAEALTAFYFLMPFSVLMDIFRLVMPSFGRGRGMLIFLTIVEMVVKLAATYFGFMLHRNEGSGAQYQPIATSNHSAHQSAAAPPPPPYQAASTAENPFTTYVPPTDGPNGQQAQPNAAYQSFPQSHSASHI